MPYVHYENVRERTRAENLVDVYMSMNYTLYNEETRAHTLQCCTFARLGLT